jgi:hypothetical protein
MPLLEWKVVIRWITNFEKTDNGNGFILEYNSETLDFATQELATTAYLGFMMGKLKPDQELFLMEYNPKTQAWKTTVSYVTYSPC